MNYDEILDLVSEADEIIGQEKRSIIYEQRLSCFRVINGFICNSEKKLWIPRRHPQKKLYPLCLDASVGGHVISGETYDQAFVREAQEELGIDVLQCPYRKLARLTPIQHGTSAFMWVYLIQDDAVPRYNTKDFISFEWLSPTHAIEKLTNGEPAKSDLIIILNAIRDLL